MATGKTTIDFGAFPGATVASVAVTGQTAIVSGSLVEAWIRPEATADHTSDEHLVDPPRVIAGDISAGVGFTIWGFDREQGVIGSSIKAPMPWGKWTVAWVWTT